MNQKLRILPCHRAVLSIAVLVMVRWRSDLTAGGQKPKTDLGHSAQAGFGPMSGPMWCPMFLVSRSDVLPDALI